MRRTIVNPDEVAAEGAREVAPTGRRRRGPEGPAPEAPTRRQPAAAAAQEEPDRFNDRVLKYIPAEVITLYLTVDGVIRAKSLSPVVSWVVFVLGLLATVLYLHYVAGVTKPLQLGVSAAAFSVWALAIGGPFIHIAGYDPLYGTIGLPFFTFLVGFIKP